MMKLSAAAANLLLVLITLPVIADHLPSSQLAQGKPETRLGPVLLDQTTVNDLVRLYGEPCGRKVISDDNQGTRGERIYSWKMGPAKLEVRTWFQPKGESAIDSVEVWGDSAEQLTTGCGLHLGAKKSDINRLYGDRYQSGSKKPHGSAFVFLQWRIGNELHVDLNENGQVDHILLVAPQE